MTDKFGELWTPVREKNKRMKLKVPKREKNRCKSDSGTPIPDSCVDSQQKKFMEGNKNLFVLGRQESSKCVSHPRTPLQTLHKAFENSKSRIQNAASEVRIDKVETGTESTTPVSSYSEVIKPILSASRNLPFGNSSNLPRNGNTSRIGPASSKTNKTKKFTIFDETFTASLKEKREPSSSSINLTQDTKMEGNYAKVNSQQDFPLSTYHQLEEDELYNSIPIPRKTQLMHNQDERCDRRMTSSTLNAVGREALPETETIGTPFWGADEGSCEEIFSLDDFIRSANIWNIKENDDYQSCTNWCAPLSASSPELQLMQEPISHMDLESVTIAFPWHGI